MATNTSVADVKLAESDEEDEPLQGGRLIDKIAEGKSKDAAEHNAALDWFLSDDPSDEGELQRVLEINVGGEKEKNIPWTIRAIDVDTLRRIRRSVAGGRAQRRQGGELDEVTANLKIVVEGTVNPPLAEIAKAKNIAGGAETALKLKFRHKSGLIGQLAGEILSLSGYDEDDVREVSAAKNS
jgi:hypothetical protein